MVIWAYYIPASALALGIAYLIAEALISVIDNHYYLRKGKR